MELLRALLRAREARGLELWSCGPDLVGPRYFYGAVGASLKNVISHVFQVTTGMLR